MNCVRTRKLNNMLDHTGESTPSAFRSDMVTEGAVAGERQNESGLHRLGLNRFGFRGRGRLFHSGRRNGRFRSGRNSGFRRCRGNRCFRCRGSGRLFRGRRCRRLLSRGRNRSFLGRIRNSRRCRDRGCGHSRRAAQLRCGGRIGFIATYHQKHQDDQQNQQLLLRTHILPAFLG